MQEEETALFIHDDAWIEDFALCDHLQAGLDVYDVVGIVGGKRRSGGQPAWWPAGLVASRPGVSMTEVGALMMQRT